MQQKECLNDIKDTELEMIIKDGTILPVSISTKIITDDNGNYIRSRSTIIDISERKRAEQKIIALKKTFCLSFKLLSCCYLQHKTQ